ncbi:DUF3145 family protein [Leucobacter weissii]|uniref:DUF3145 family protein n=1 Tax=Leucobacter weissii TaxID=1983706 RepID=A0A939SCW1_9MICO|nr:DUF3145 family protein [Leucobacter weissii]MBO1902845.1 DUF3145 family protein [Leucobacter weissii]
MTQIAARAQASGWFFVHSCPRDLTSHLEWALAREIGGVVKLRWSPQPLVEGTVRAETGWSGPPGTAVEIASSLFGWKELRFEITEDRTANDDGGRWMHTPRLGVFHLRTDAAGNGLIGEEAVRAAISNTGGDGARLARELRLRLGEAWDEELEPFRRTADRDEETIFAVPSLHAG